MLQAPLPAGSERRRLDGSFLLIGWWFGSGWRFRGGGAWRIHGGAAVEIGGARAVWGRRSLLARLGHTTPPHNPPPPPLLAMSLSLSISPTISIPAFLLPISLAFNPLGYTSSISLAINPLGYTTLAAPHTPPPAHRFHHPLFCPLQLSRRIFSISGDRHQTRGCNHLGFSRIRLKPPFFRPSAASDDARWDQFCSIYVSNLPFVFLSGCPRAFSCIAAPKSESRRLAS